MSARRRLHAALAALLLCLCAASATALPRDKTQRARFVKLNPCPATGETRGPCPGWQVDHTRALMHGGEDTPANMQWISNADHKLKTRAEMRKCTKAKRCRHRGLKQ